MTRFIATKIVNSILGKYLNIQEFSRLSTDNIEIKNASVNENIFLSLGVPLKVLHGSIGTLSLQIPGGVMSLLGSSYDGEICVEVSDVYLLVDLVSIAGSDAKKQFYESQRQMLLNEHELNSRHLFAVLEELSGNVGDHDLEREAESTLQKLLVTSFEGGKVVLRNVHIRFEDKTSSPLVNFAGGITFESFSTNVSNRSTSQVSARHRPIHRISTMRNLNIYGDTTPKGTPLYQDLSSNERISAFKKGISTGDIITLDVLERRKAPTPLHSYILSPLTFEIRLEWNPYNIPGFAYVAAELSLPLLDINIHDTVYNAVISLGRRQKKESLNSIMKSKPDFRKLLSSGTPRKEVACARWKFAIDAVTSMIQLYTPPFRRFNFSRTKASLEAYKRYREPYLREYTAELEREKKRLLELVKSSSHKYEPLPDFRTELLSSVPTPPKGHSLPNSSTSPAKTTLDSRKLIVEAEHYLHAFVVQDLMTEAVEAYERQLQLKGMHSLKEEKTGFLASYFGWGTSSSTSASKTSKLSEQPVTLVGSDVHVKSVSGPGAPVTLSNSTVSSIQPAAPIAPSRVGDISLKLALQSCCISIFLKEEPIMQASLAATAEYSMNHKDWTLKSDVRSVNIDDFVPPEEEPWQFQRFHPLHKRLSAGTGAAKDGQRGGRVLTRRLLLSNEGGAEDHLLDLTVKHLPSESIDYDIFLESKPLRILYTPSMLLSMLAFMNSTPDLSSLLAEAGDAFTSTQRLADTYAELSERLRLRLDLRVAAPIIIVDCPAGGALARPNRPVSLVCKLGVLTIKSLPTSGAADYAYSRIHKLESSEIANSISPDALQRRKDRVRNVMSRDSLYNSWNVDFSELSIFFTQQSGSELMKSQSSAASGPVSRALVGGKSFHPIIEWLPLLEPLSLSIVAQTLIGEEAAAQLKINRAAMRVTAKLGRCRLHSSRVLFLFGSDFMQSMSMFFDCMTFITSHPESPASAAKSGSASSASALKNGGSESNLNGVNVANITRSNVPITTHSQQRSKWMAQIDEMEKSKNQAKQPSDEKRLIRSPVSIGSAEDLSTRGTRFDHTKSSTESSSEFSGLLFFFEFEGALLHLWDLHRISSLEIIKKKRGNSSKFHARNLIPYISSNNEGFNHTGLEGKPDLSVAVQGLEIWMNLAGTNIAAEISLREVECLDPSSSSPFKIVSSSNPTSIGNLASSSNPESGASCGDLVFIRADLSDIANKDGLKNKVAITMGSIGLNLTPDHIAVLQLLGTFLGAFLASMGDPQSWEFSSSDAVKESTSSSKVPPLGSVAHGQLMDSLHALMEKSDDLDGDDELRSFRTSRTSSFTRGDSTDFVDTVGSPVSPPTPPDIDSLQHGASSHSILENDAALENFSKTEKHALLGEERIAAAVSSTNGSLTSLSSKILSSSETWLTMTLEGVHLGLFYTNRSVTALSETKTSPASQYAPLLNLSLTHFGLDLRLHASQAMLVQLSLGSMRLSDPFYSNERFLDVESSSSLGPHRIVAGMASRVKSLTNIPNSSASGVLPVLEATAGVGGSFGSITVAVVPKTSSLFVGTDFYISITSAPLQLHFRMPMLNRLLAFSKVCSLDNVVQGLTQSAITQAKEIALSTTVLQVNLDVSAITLVLPVFEAADSGISLVLSDLSLSNSFRLIRPALISGNTQPPNSGSISDLEGEKFWLQALQYNNDFTGQGQKPKNPGDAFIVLDTISLTLKRLAISQFTSNSRSDEVPGDNMLLGVDYNVQLQRSLCMSLHNRLISTENDGDTDNTLSVVGASISGVRVKLGGQSTQLSLQRSQYLLLLAVLEGNIGCLGVSQKMEAEIVETLSFVNTDDLSWAARELDLAESSLSEEQASTLSFGNKDEQVLGRRRSSFSLPSMGNALSKGETNSKISSKRDEEEVEVEPFSSDSTSLTMPKSSGNKTNLVADSSDVAPAENVPFHVLLQFSFQSPLSLLIRPPSGLPVQLTVSPYFRFKGCLLNGSSSSAVEHPSEGTPLPRSVSNSGYRDGPKQTFEISARLVNFSIGCPATSNKEKNWDKFMEPIWNNLVFSAPSNPKLRTGEMGGLQVDISSVGEDVDLKATIDGLYFSLLPRHLLDLLEFGYPPALLPLLEDITELDKLTKEMEAALEVPVESSNAETGLNQLRIPSTANVVGVDDVSTPTEQMDSLEYLESFEYITVPRRLKATVIMNNACFLFPSSCTSRARSCLSISTGGSLGLLVHGGHMEATGSLLNLSVSLYRGWMSDIQASNSGSEIDKKNSSPHSVGIGPRLLPVLISQFLARSVCSQVLSPCNITVKLSKDDVTCPSLHNRNVRITESSYVATFQGEKLVVALLPDLVHVLVLFLQHTTEYLQKLDPDTLLFLRDLMYGESEVTPLNTPTSESSTAPPSVISRKKLTLNAQWDGLEVILPRTITASHKVPSSITTGYRIRNKLDPFLSVRVGSVSVAAVVCDEFVTAEVNLVVDLMIASSLMTATSPAKSTLPSLKSNPSQKDAVSDTWSPLLKNPLEFGLRVHFNNPISADSNLVAVEGDRSLLSNSETLWGQVVGHFLDSEGHTMAKMATNPHDVDTCMYVSLSTKNELNMQISSMLLVTLLGGLIKWGVSIKPVMEMATRHVDKCMGVLEFPNTGNSITSKSALETSISGASSTRFFASFDFPKIRLNTRFKALHMVISDDTDALCALVMEGLSAELDFWDIRNFNSEALNDDFITVTPMRYSDQANDIHREEVQDAGSTLLLVSVMLDRFEILDLLNCDENGFDIIMSVTSTNSSPDRNTSGPSSFTSPAIMLNAWSLNHEWKPILSASSNTFTSLDAGKRASLQPPTKAAFSKFLDFVAIQHPNYNYTHTGSSIEGMTSRSGVLLKGGNFFADELSLKMIPALAGADVRVEALRFEWNDRTLWRVVTEAGRILSTMDSILHISYHQELAALEPEIVETPSADESGERNSYQVIPAVSNSIENQARFDFELALSLHRASTNRTSRFQDDLTHSVDSKDSSDEKVPVSVEPIQKKSASAASSTFNAAPYGFLTGLLSATIFVRSLWFSFNSEAARKKMLVASLTQLSVNLKSVVPVDVFEMYLDLLTCPLEDRSSNPSFVIHSLDSTPNSLSVGLSVGTINVVDTTELSLSHIYLVHARDHSVSDGSEGNLKRRQRLLKSVPAEQLLEARPLAPVALLHESLGAHHVSVVHSLLHTSTVSDSEKGMVTALTLDVQLLHPLQPAFSRHSMDLKLRMGKIDSNIWLPSLLEIEGALKIADIGGLLSALSSSSSTSSSFIEADGPESAAPAGEPTPKLRSNPFMRLDVLIEGNRVVLPEGRNPLGVRAVVFVSRPLSLRNELLEQPIILDSSTPLPLRERMLIEIGNPQVSVVSNGNWSLAERLHLGSHELFAALSAPGSTSPIIGGSDGPLDRALAESAAEKLQLLSSRGSLGISLTRPLQDSTKDSSSDMTISPEEGLKLALSVPPISLQVSPVAVRVLVTLAGAQLASNEPTLALQTQGLLHVHSLPVSQRIASDSLAFLLSAVGDGATEGLTLSEQSSSDSNFFSKKTISSIFYSSSTASLRSCSLECGVCRRAGTLRGPTVCGSCGLLVCLPCRATERVYESQSRLLRTVCRGCYVDLVCSGLADNIISGTVISDPVNARAVANKYIVPGSFYFKHLSDISESFTQGFAARNADIPSGQSGGVSGGNVHTNVADKLNKRPWDRTSSFISSVESSRRSSVVDAPSASSIENHTSSSSESDSMQNLPTSSDGTTILSTEQLLPKLPVHQNAAFLKLSEDSSKEGSQPPLQLTLALSSLSLDLLQPTSRRGTSGSSTVGGTRLTPLARVQMLFLLVSLEVDTLTSSVAGGVQLGYFNVLDRRPGLDLPLSGADDFRPVTRVLFASANSVPPALQRYLQGYTHSIESSITSKSSSSSTSSSSSGSDIYEGMSLVDVISSLPQKIITLNLKYGPLYTSKSKGNSDNLTSSAASKSNNSSSDSSTNMEVSARKFYRDAARAEAEFISTTADRQHDGIVEVGVSGIHLHLDMSLVNSILAMLNTTATALSSSTSTERRGEGDLSKSPDSTEEEGVTIQERASLKRLLDVVSGLTGSEKAFQRVVLLDQASSPVSFYVLLRISSVMLVLSESNNIASPSAWNKNVTNPAASSASLSGNGGTTNKGKGSLPEALVLSLKSVEVRYNFQVTPQAGINLFSINPIWLSRVAHISPALLNWDVNKSFLENDTTINFVGLPSLDPNSPHTPTSSVSGDVESQSGASTRARMEPPHGLMARAVVQQSVNSVWLRASGVRLDLAKAVHMRSKVHSDSEVLIGSPTTRSCTDSTSSSTPLADQMMFSPLDTLAMFVLIQNIVEPFGFEGDISLTNVTLTELDASSVSWGLGRILPLQLLHPTPHILESIYESAGKSQYVERLKELEHDLKTESLHSLELSEEDVVHDTGRRQAYHRAWASPPLLSHNALAISRLPPGRLKCNISLFDRIALIIPLSTTSRLTELLNNWLATAAPSYAAPGSSSGNETDLVTSPLSSPEEVFPFSPSRSDIDFSPSHKVRSSNFTEDKGVSSAVNPLHALLPLLPPPMFISATPRHPDDFELLLPRHMPSKTLSFVTYSSGQSTGQGLEGRIVLSGIGKADYHIEKANGETYHYDAGVTPSRLISLSAHDIIAQRALGHKAGVFTDELAHYLHPVEFLFGDPSVSLLSRHHIIQDLQRSLLPSAVQSSNRSLIQQLEASIRCLPRSSFIMEAILPVSCSKLAAVIPRGTPQLEYALRGITDASDMVPIASRNPSSTQSSSNLTGPNSETLDEVKKRILATDCPRLLLRASSMTLNASIAEFALTVLADSASLLTQKGKSKLKSKKNESESISHGPSSSSGSDIYNPFSNMYANAYSDVDGGLADQLVLDKSKKGTGVLLLRVSDINFHSIGNPTSTMDNAVISLERMRGLAARTQYRSRNRGNSVLPGFSYLLSPSHSASSSSFEATSIATADVLSEYHSSDSVYRLNSESSRSVSERSLFDLSALHALALAQAMFRPLLPYLIASVSMDVMVSAFSRLSNSWEPVLEPLVESEGPYSGLSASLIGSHGFGGGTTIPYSLSSGRKRLVSLGVDVLDTDYSAPGVGTGTGRLPVRGLTLNVNPVDISLSQAVLESLLLAVASFQSSQTSGSTAGALPLGDRGVSSASMGDTAPADRKFYIASGSATAAPQLIVNDSYLPMLLAVPNWSSGIEGEGFGFTMPERSAFCIISSQCNLTYESLTDFCLSTSIIASSNDSTANTGYNRFPFVVGPTTVLLLPGFRMGVFLPSRSGSEWDTSSAGLADGERFRRYSSASMGISRSLSNIAATPAASADDVGVIRRNDGLAVVHRTAPEFASAFNSPLMGATGASLFARFLDDPRAFALTDLGALSDTGKSPVVQLQLGEMGSTRLMESLLLVSNVSSEGSSGATGAASIVTHENGSERDTMGATEGEGDRRTLCISHPVRVRNCTKIALELIHTLNPRVQQSFSVFLDQNKLSKQQEHPCTPNGFRIFREGAYARNDPIPDAQNQMIYFGSVLAPGQYTTVPSVDSLSLRPAVLVESLDGRLLCSAFRPSAPFEPRAGLSAVHADFFEELFRPAQGGVRWRLPGPLGFLALQRHCGAALSLNRSHFLVAGVNRYDPSLGSHVMSLSVRAPQVLSNMLPSPLLLYSYCNTGNYADNSNSRTSGMETINSPRHKYYLHPAVLQAAPASADSYNEKMPFCLPSLSIPSGTAVEIFGLPPSSPPSQFDFVSQDSYLRAQKPLTIGIGMEGTLTSTPFRLGAPTLRRDGGIAGCCQSLKLPGRVMGPNVSVSTMGTVVVKVNLDVFPEEPFRPSTSPSSLESSAREDEEIQGKLPSLVGPPVEALTILEALDEEFDAPKPFALPVNMTFWTPVTLTNMSTAPLTFGVVNGGEAHAQLNSVQLRHVPSVVEFFENNRLMMVKWASPLPSERNHYSTEIGQNLPDVFSLKPRVPLPKELQQGYFYNFYNYLSPESMQSVHVPQNSSEAANGDDPVSLTDSGVYSPLENPHLAGDMVFYEESSATAATSSSLIVTHPGSQPRANSMRFLEDQWDHEAMDFNKFILAVRGGKHYFNDFSTGHMIRRRRRTKLYYDSRFEDLGASQGAGGWLGLAYNRYGNPLPPQNTDLTNIPAGKRAALLSVPHRKINERGRPLMPLLYFGAPLGSVLPSHMRNSVPFTAESHVLDSILSSSDSFVDDMRASSGQNDRSTEQSREGSLLLRIGAGMWSVPASVHMLGDSTTAIEIPLASTSSFLLHNCATNPGVQKATIVPTNTSNKKVSLNPLKLGSMLGSMVSSGIEGAITGIDNLVSDSNEAQINYTNAFNGAFPAIVELTTLLSSLAHNTQLNLRQMSLGSFGATESSLKPHEMPSNAMTYTVHPAILIVNSSNRVLCVRQASQFNLIPEDDRTPPPSGIVDNFLAVPPRSYRPLHWFDATVPPHQRALQLSLGNNNLEKKKPGSGSTTFSESKYSDLYGNASTSEHDDDIASQVLDIRNWSVPIPLLASISTESTSAALLPPEHHIRIFNAFRTVIPQADADVAIVAPLVDPRAPIFVRTSYGLTPLASAILNVAVRVGAGPGGATVVTVSERVPIEHPIVPPISLARERADARSTLKYVDRDYVRMYSDIALTALPARLKSLYNFNPANPREYGSPKKSSEVPADEVSAENRLKTALELEMFASRSFTSKTVFSISNFSSMALCFRQQSAQCYNDAGVPLEAKQQVQPVSAFAGKDMLTYHSPLGQPLATSWFFVPPRSTVPVGLVDPRPVFTGQEISFEIRAIDPRTGEPFPTLTKTTFNFANTGETGRLVSAGGELLIETVLDGGSRTLIVYNSSGDVDAMLPPLGVIPTQFSLRLPPSAMLRSALDAAALPALVQLLRSTENTGPESFTDQNQLLLSRLGLDIGASTGWNGAPADLRAFLSKWSQSRIGSAVFVADAHLQVPTVSATELTSMLRQAPLARREALALADAVEGVFDSPSSTWDSSTTKNVKSMDPAELESKANLLEKRFSAKFTPSGHRRKASVLAPKSSIELVDTYHEHEQDLVGDKLLPLLPFPDPLDDQDKLTITSWSSSVQVSFLSVSISLSVLIPDISHRKRLERRRVPSEFLVMNLGDLNVRLRMHSPVPNSLEFMNSVEFEIGSMSVDDASPGCRHPVVLYFSNSSSSESSRSKPAKSTKAVLFTLQSAPRAHVSLLGPQAVSLSRYISGLRIYRITFGMDNLYLYTSYGMLARSARLTKELGRAANRAGFRLGDFIGPSREFSDILVPTIATSAYFHEHLKFFYGNMFTNKKLICDDDSKVSSMNSTTGSSNVRIGYIPKSVLLDLVNQVLPSLFDKLYAPNGGLDGIGYERTSSSFLSPTDPEKELLLELENLSIEQRVALRLRGSQLGARASIRESEVDLRMLHIQRSNITFVYTYTSHSADNASSSGKSTDSSVLRRKEQDMDIRGVVRMLSSNSVTIQFLLDLLLKQSLSIDLVIPNVPIQGRTLGLNSLIMDISKAIQSENMMRGAVAGIGVAASTASKVLIAPIKLGLKLGKAVGSTVVDALDHVSGGMVESLVDVVEDVVVDATGGRQGLSDFEGKIQIVSSHPFADLKHIATPQYSQLLRGRKRLPRVFFAPEMASMQRSAVQEIVVATATMDKGISYADIVDVVVDLEGPGTDKRGILLTHTHAIDLIIHNIGFKSMYVKFVRAYAIVNAPISFRLDPPFVLFGDVNHGGSAFPLPLQKLLEFKETYEYTKSLLL